MSLYYYPKDYRINYKTEGKSLFNFKILYTTIRLFYGRGYVYAES